MTKTILEVNKLVKTYKPKGLLPRIGNQTNVLPVIDDVSFTLARGEMLGLIGESGSGKTSIGKSIIKLTNINDGSINLFGINISQLSDRQFRKHRHNIQMIFQDLDAALNPNMSIQQILIEILQRNKKQPPQKQFETLNQLIKEVNLESDILHRYPAELSGGQKRRVAIAAVLALKPKIIIADEPTTGLDSYTQTIIMKLIARLQQEHQLSMLLISHDLQLVEQTCHRIIVLYLGNIIEMGTSEQISQTQAHPYTRMLWNSHLSNREVQQIQNQRHDIRSGLHDFERPKQGCRFAPRCTQYQQNSQPDVCTTANSKPILRELSPGHQVACHFPLLSK